MSDGERERERERASERERESLPPPGRVTQAGRREEVRGREERRPLKHNSNNH